MRKLISALSLCLICISLCAKGLASAPFINLDNYKFTVKIPIFENDSLVVQENKVLMENEKLSINCNGISFEVPVYNELIKTIDSLDTNAPVFSVSDIEGNFTALYNLLLNNSVIDKDCNWIFGKGQLVIVGDMVDRGEFVNESLYLLYKLDFQANKSGGRVHYLLGNHDMMLLSGDHRYVNQKYKYISYSFNTPIVELYNDNTLLGHWMRSKNTILKLNKIMFVHAGISPELINNNYTISEINYLVKKYLNTWEKDERTLFILKNKGPFWYRGLVYDYNDDKKIPENILDLILNYFKVDKLVIGHTIVDNISYDYHDKLLRLDVYHIENPQALMIIDHIFYKADQKGKLSKI